MQISGTHPGPTESETLGMGSGASTLDKFESTGRMICAEFTPHAT